MDGKILLSLTLLLLGGYALADTGLQVYSGIVFGACGLICLWQLLLVEGFKNKFLLLIYTIVSLALGYMGVTGGF